ncbi:hypothetical protein FQN49_000388 [Arthroderma sp. PD_2]|nr:hypothetical protein FQN49_000388 [Arthroderma sp. PD_2]
MGTADTDETNRRWSGAVPAPLTATTLTSTSSDPRDARCTASQKRHSTPGSLQHLFLPTTTPASTPTSTSTSTSRYSAHSKHTLPPMATGITASSSTHLFHRQPSSMYHGNQPQYTYSPPSHHQPPPPPPSSSRSSADISPSTRSHRQVEVQSTHSTTLKSLPSIHEALGKSNPLPYPHPSQSAVCGPSQTSGHIAPSSSLMPGPSAEGPSGPSNPFSSNNSSAPSLRETILNSQQQQHQSTPSQSEGSIRSLDSQSRSIRSIGSEKSASRASLAERTSIVTSHAPGFELSTTTTAMSSPTSYVSPVSYSQPSYPSHRGAPTSQTFPPPSFESRSSHSTWNFGASDHTPMEGVKSTQSNGMRPYDNTIKRQLDDYDVRASLNEVRDTSSRTLDLLRPHSQRPQSTRPESIDSNISLPSLAEIDELLHLHRHTAEILERIRSAAISHEHSLSEQRSQQQMFKSEPARDKERMTMYEHEYKNGSSLSGSNNHIMNSSSLEKKRRKAAPPGRCHSCNRAETPEWRRGPDGARTLCNACGLHYAKLTRKAGMNKTSSSSGAPTTQMAMAASNIRPRGGVGSRSPPLHS